MDATCPAPTAPDRCADRSRRLGQIKFVALVIEPGPAPAATLSPSPDRLYRGWRAYLSRVFGRLVAARP